MWDYFFARHLVAQYLANSRVSDMDMRKITNSKKSHAPHISVGIYALCYFGGACAHALNLNVFPNRFLFVKPFNLQTCLLYNRPCGLMDESLVCERIKCRFESCQDCFCMLMPNLLELCFVPFGMVSLLVFGSIKAAASAATFSFNAESI